MVKRLRLDTAPLADCYFLEERHWKKLRKSLKPLGLAVGNFEISFVIPVW